MVEGSHAGHEIPNEIEDITIAWCQTHTDEGLHEGFSRTLAKILEPSEPNRAGNS